MEPRDFGNIFKEAREEQGISLKEANWRSRIHPNVIDDIEKGYTERIGKIYFKSFLKKYSEFLGLNVDDILVKYEQLIGKEEKTDLPQESVKPILEKTVVQPPVVEKEGPSKNIPEKVLDWAQEPQNSKMLGIVVGVFLVSLFLLLGIRGCARGIEERRRMANEAPVITRNETMKQSQTPEIKPAKVIVPEPKPAPKPEPIKPTTSNENPATSKPQVAVVQDLPLIVTLRATGEVWIQVFAGGKTIFVGTLKNGDTKTLKTDNELKVWTGKGEFLEFIVDGKDLGKVVDGVVKNINVSHKGIKVNNVLVKSLEQ